MFIVTVNAGSCDAIILRQNMLCRTEQKGIGKSKFTFAQKCLLGHVTSCDMETSSGPRGCVHVHMYSAGC